MTNVYDGPPDDRQSDDPAMPTSRFRPRYRALTEEEKRLHDAIKAKAEELERLIDRSVPADFIPVGAARYHALAITSLEQAVIWAVKGLTA
jgi:hypothetical protein